MYSPRIKDDAVFFCGGYSWNDRSEVFALTAATGQLRWHVPVGSCAAPPSIVGSTVVAFADPEHGSQYVVHGIDAASGRTIWRHEIVPTSFQPTFRATLGTFVYLTSFRGPLRRVNVAAGILEVIPLEHESGDGLWLAGGNDRVVVGAGNAVWAASGAAGTLTRGATLQSRIRRVDSAVVDGDLLVLVDRERNSLTAFNLADGSIRWSRQWKGLQSEAAIVGGRLFVNALTPKFELQALDPSSGTPSWSAGDGSFYPPTVADGRVYAAGRSSVFVLDEDTGKVAAQIPASREVITSPVRSGDLVIFATIDGTLHAVRPALPR